MAALAGMSRDTFNEATGRRRTLRNWILQQQKDDQTTGRSNSTPSFVIDGKKYAGEMSYDAFRKLLPDA